MSDTQQNLNEQTSLYENFGFLSKPKEQTPNWFSVADVTVDLNELVAVKTWYYFKSPNTPKGIRFILKNGVTVDTVEMTEDEATRSYDKLIAKLDSLHRVTK